MQFIYVHTIDLLTIIWHYCVAQNAHLSCARYIIVPEHKRQSQHSKNRVSPTNISVDTNSHYKVEHQTWCYKLSVPADSFIWARCNLVQSAHLTLSCRKSQMITTSQSINYQKLTQHYQWKYFYSWQFLLCTPSTFWLLINTLLRLNCHAKIFVNCKTMIWLFFSGFLDT